MAPLSLSAILLRSHAYSESSRILRFLTREHGVVAAIARGVRGKGGKGGSSLEMFARGTLTLDHRPGRDLQNFRSFDLERAHRGLSAGMVRFGGAAFLGEFALRHGAEEGNPLLFDALDETLEWLEDAGESEALAAVVATGWRFSALLGYTPEVDQCVVCGQPVEPGVVVHFDHGAGGVIGPECVDPHRPSPGPRIGPGTRELLGLMLSGERPPALPRPAAHLKLLHDFTIWHMGGGRGLEAWTFLAEQVEALPAGDSDPSP